ncbi:MAG: metallophosphoesterase [Campylobacterota bacterium]|nr:metallophosphoesterase [Campylobacterota bacterium]
MKSLLFVVAFLGVFALLNMYISKRLIAKLDAKDRTKKLFRLFLILNFVGIILYMVGRYYANMPNTLYFLFSLPIGVLFLLFCTAVIYDILRTTCTYIPISTQRRLFFKKSLDISSLLVATALSAKGVYEATVLRVEDVVVKIKNLKHNYKIVQLSDIHIGGLVDATYIKKMVHTVNELKPDVVVITGDIIDVDISNASKALYELSQLKSRYGTYAVVGNHEYFHGITQIISALNAVGIKVLENESIYIGKEKEGFNLVGVYDVFGYRVNHHIPDINKALENIESSSPTILLAHQPRFIDEVENRVDLMLSGHTHGGQLYPFRALVKLQQPYIDGLHQHNKNLQIYVNKGAGFWGPPMRLGASSEITQIRVNAS